MAQYPGGYGWFGAPTQPGFAPVGQTPYAPAQPQYGIGFNLGPAPAPGFAWQQPAAGPAYGPGNPYAYPAPQQGVVGDIGFGLFGQPTVSPPNPAATNQGSFQQNPQPTAPSTTHVADPDVSVRRNPSPAPVDTQTNRTVPALSASDTAVVSKSNDDAVSDGKPDHRNTSRYQEGLKNMADLMTDVELSDDVLQTLKSRFDLG